MRIENLEKIGFRRTEASIYLTLLELGEAQAGELSKKTQINRTTIYDALERLLEKGLVTYIIQAHKKVFRPIAPAKILENKKKQERIAQEMLPELSVLYKHPKEGEEANIYRGRKGIRSILYDILKYKEYVSFGSSGEFLEVMGHDFIQYQKRKKELRIKSRVILPEKTRKTEIVKLAWAHYRFIPDKYASLTTTWIYGNNVAIVIWGETPIATVIKSKAFADTNRNYFELLWKQAKD